MNYEPVDDEWDFDDLRDQIGAWYGDAAVRGGRIVGNYVLTHRGHDQIIFVGEFPDSPPSVDEVG